MHVDYNLFGASISLRFFVLLQAGIIDLFEKMALKIGYDSTRVNIRCKAIEDIGEPRIIVKNQVVTL